MKARYVPHLTREQEKVLIQNIDGQCREATKQKEIDFHTLWIYALHKYSKDPWGLQRIEGLYKEVFRHVEEMRKHQEDSRDADMPYHAMRYELLQDGIDMEKLFRDFGRTLLLVRVVDHKEDLRK